MTIRGHAQERLTALVGAGFLGAAFVRRNGVPVMSVLSQSANEDTLGAMAAAALGAGEAVFEDWGAGLPSLIVLEGPRLRMAIAGLDDESLIVAVAPGNMDSTEFQARVLQERDAILRLLSEA